MEKWKVTFTGHLISLFCHGLGLWCCFPAFALSQKKNQKNPKRSLSFRKEQFSSASKNFLFHAFVREVFVGWQWFQDLMCVLRRVQALKGALRIIFCFICLHLPLWNALYWINVSSCDSPRTQYSTLTELTVWMWAIMLLYSVCTGLPSHDVVACGSYSS